MITDGVIIVALPGRYFELHQIQLMIIVCAEGILCWQH